MRDVALCIGGACDGVTLVDEKHEQQSNECPRLILRFTCSYLPGQEEDNSSVRSCRIEKAHVRRGVVVG